MDHRRLGRELKLFTTSPLVGGGLPLWLPNGAAVRASLEAFILDEERRAGYRHVSTPVLAKRELYERSGHWAHYRDDMFPPMQVGEEQLVLRPMNCPHHVIVYQSEERSWRDLPLRIAELAPMYRDERSGVVGGLSRVRSMTLNDAHLFCQPDDVPEEFERVVAMIERCYASLGISGHRYRLSLRQPGEGKFVDDDEMWNSSQQDLRAVLRAAGVEYEEAVGEAAFYGPKLDVQVVDRRGREYTLSTVQLDVHLPKVLDLSYVAPGGQRRTPVMVHRSVLSTMERMVAHLLEVHGANLPLWLAPVHALVLPVAASHGVAAAGLAAELIDAGLRAEVDAREHTLGARIREAQRLRTPCTLVIGDREVADGTVALRLRGGGRKTLPRAQFIHLLRDAVAQRFAELEPAGDR